MTHRSGFGKGLHRGQVAAGIAGRTRVARVGHELAAARRGGVLLSLPHGHRVVQRKVQRDDAGQRAERAVVPFRQEGRHQNFTTGIDRRTSTAI